MRKRFIRYALLLLAAALLFSCTDVAVEKTDIEQNADVDDEKNPSFKVTSYYQGANRIGAGDFEKPDLFEIGGISNGNHSYSLKIADQEPLSGIVKVSKKRGAIGGTVLSLANWKSIDDGTVSIVLTLADRDIEFSYNSVKEPYKIRSWQDLQGIKNDLAGDYTLENSIVFPEPGSDGFPSSGFYPLGQSPYSEDSSVVFTGTFDGKNHVISNFYINRPGKGMVALFGAARGDGFLRNVGIETSPKGVTGGENSAILVAHSSDKTITNSYVTGSVTGQLYVGGIAGYFAGEMSYCYSKADVTSLGSGRAHAGGLIGVTSLNGTVVKRSYATGSIEGRNRVGGLVGTNSSGGRTTIEDSYAKGSVEAIGSESGFYYVGGLVGDNYSTKSVIRDSYATGRVIDSVPGGSFGGLVGVNRGTVEGSVWDKDTTGRTDSAGGFGLDTETMKNKRTFDKEWDLKTVWGIDYNRKINDGYPFLRNVGGQ